MRIIAILLYMSLAGSSVWAQHGIQQKRVNGFVFQTRMVKGAEKQKCFSWLPLNQDTLPSQYVVSDSRGRDFLYLKVSAQIESPASACDLKLGPAKMVKFLGDRKTSQGIVRDYEIRVQPPATVIVATSAKATEELVFETPIELDSERGFFEFFSRSTIHFENRLTQLTTNAVDSDVKSTFIFPIFGGRITAPLPWLDHWFGSYSLFQNLGNFYPKRPADVAFSEVLFELNRVDVFESLGTQLTVSAELRGRNVFQTSDKRPFSIGQVIRPGVGLDLIYFPAFFSPFGESRSRMGLQANYHLGIGKIANREMKQWAWEGVAHYRLSTRGPFVAGLGVSQFRQSAMLDPALTTRTHENSTNYFFRISLFPVLSRGSN